jgi:nucleoside-diphosphate-sugar epimerase
MDSAPSLRGVTVLVTGATGFIGSHLVERLLSEGAIVRCLLRCGVADFSRYTITESRYGLRHHDDSRNVGDGGYLGS